MPPFTYKADGDILYHTEINEIFTTLESLGVDVDALEAGVASLVSSVTALTSGKADAVHTHSVSDLTATGGTSTSFLRKDNTWATPTNTTYSAMTQAEAEGGTSTTGRLITGQRLLQAINALAPVKAVDLTNGLATKADVDHDHDGRYYTSTAVDTLLTAQTTAINARTPDFPMLSGLTYSTFTHGLGLSGSTSGVSITADRIYITPIYINETTTFSNIGVNVTSAAADAMIRVGMCNYSLQTGQATLIHDAGIINASTTGVKELSFTQTLQPGWAWFVVSSSVNVAIAGGNPGKGILHSATGTPIGTRVAISVPFGPFPPTFSVTLNSGPCLGVHLKVA